ncbi:hypothetical protein AAHA92_06248 [Salvia divinorum]|uniref:Zinc finger GRF-type domain-containing protein n=1 Tax=Salvia divinorum TaxID=28513 RepID=A0ABD1I667_SALDI
MDLRCAGKSAMHAGRFYYKCPVNGKHPGSFKWCDEYHNEPPFKEPGVELNQSKHVDYVRPTPMHDDLRGNGGCVHCYGNKSPNPIMAHILIIFMGLVLILLGILLGKVM